MPLIGSENPIWALLDCRKSRSFGKGFSSGASVAHCAGCNPEQVVSSDSAVGMDVGCPGMCLHFMGSRGQHHTGTVGENKTPSPFATSEQHCRC